MNLIPCASCRRHVRETAAVCPFCRAPVLATPDGETVEIPLGLSRGALVLLGASMALGACSNSGNSRGGGESRIALPYGAPPIIASAPPRASESARPESPPAASKEKEIAK